MKWRKCIIFCPKCGNQLSDSAAFCDKCGNPIGQPVAENRNSTENPRVDEKLMDEKIKKIITLTLFCIKSLVLIILFWILCGTEGKCLTVFFSGEYEWVLEQLWDDKMGWLCVICALIVTIGSVVSLLVDYIIPFIKRTFSIYSLMELVISIFTAVLTLYVGISMQIGVNQVLNKSSIGIAAIGFIFAALDIVNGFLYRSAGAAESAGKYMPSETAKKLTKLADDSDQLSDIDSWICPECGTRNRKLDDHCKDCNYYK